MHMTENVQTADEESRVKEEKRKKRNEDIRFIVIFVFFFSLFRFFLYDWYIVPSGSMIPTLLIGDMPFVEKWAYGYSRHSIWFSPKLFSGRVFFKNNVKRGEVVVFKHPQNPDTPEYNDMNIVKRVIGLPGDRISVQNGVIYVNGECAQLTPKGSMIHHDEQSHQFLELKLYEEKLPGSDLPSHTVAYLEEAKYSAPNHYAEIMVPAGHYFVMGDDRDLSKDSRCGLGFVPEENLMGRVLCTVFSIANGVKIWEFWLWFQNIRYDRILKRVI